MNSAVAPTCRTALVIGVAATAGALSALAQTVRGTVSDSVTAKPVAGCYVSLINHDQQAVARVQTDSTGRFMLRAQVPGSYMLRFERLGYRSVVSELIALDVKSDELLSVLLTSAAVPLPPVIVSAEIRDVHLVNVGFYERRRAGPGSFMDPEEIEKRQLNAQLFVDLLRAVPGVTLVALGRGGTTRGVHFTGMPTCKMGPPRVFLDGVLISLSSNPRDAADDLNQVIGANDVLAIELYKRPSEIPAQYGGAESGCGVMLIWTKH